MCANNQITKSPIEDNNAEESRYDAQDRDWEANNEESSSEPQSPDLVHSSYVPPVTRAAAMLAALAQNGSEPVTTESGSSAPDLSGTASSVASPSAASPSPAGPSAPGPSAPRRRAPCQRCFLRKQRNPSHVCLRAPNRKGCGWCTKMKKTCHQVPQEFDDLVREALEMRGDSQRRAIAGVLQRIRMRSRRINQGIRPLGN